MDPGEGPEQNRKNHKKLCPHYFLAIGVLPFHNLLKVKNASKPTDLFIWRCFQYKLLFNTIYKLYNIHGGEAVCQLSLNFFCYISDFTISHIIKANTGPPAARPYPQHPEHLSPLPSWAKKMPIFPLFLRNVSTRILESLRQYKFKKDTNFFPFF